MDDRETVFGEMTQPIDDVGDFDEWEDEEDDATYQAKAELAAELRMLDFAVDVGDITDDMLRRHIEGSLTYDDVRVVVEAEEEDEEDVELLPFDYEDDDDNDVVYVGNYPPSWQDEYEHSVGFAPSSQVPPVDVVRRVTALVNQGPAFYPVVTKV